MKHLEPTLLWNYFHDITQIPRPSKKEEKIIALKNKKRINFLEINENN